MNKTKIEYADYSWNPLSGCTKGCSYCYARQLAQGRLKNLYLANPNVAPGCDPSDPFSPRVWPYRYIEPIFAEKPCRIFTCDMGDLFDPHIPNNWIETVLNIVRLCPRHTFLFLTKRPDLARSYKFPPNCWAGVTIEDASTTSRQRLSDFFNVHARVRYISYEPLLGPVQRVPDWIDWIIVGAMTGPKAVKPNPKWVQTLIDCADASGIPIFLKDNLNWAERRTEWPKGITT